MPYPAYFPLLYSFLRLHIMVNIPNRKIKQVYTFLYFLPIFWQVLLYGYKQLGKNCDNCLYAAGMSVYCARYTTKQN